MSIRSWIQILLMGLVIIAVNSMKHWTILILPDIVKVESDIRQYDKTFYIVLNYMCYFYGLLFGSWIWQVLTKRISNAMAIFLSLILIGLANYLQSLNNGLTYLCTFRFIVGAVTNVQKLGKSFVHEFISKKNRKRAFQVENASYVLGSIAAPFIGYYIYNSAGKNYVTAALIVSIFIIVLAACFYIVFIFQPIVEETIEDDEERIAIIKIPTFVSIDFRSMLIHCFYSNLYAKNLILTYIINSACFHVDFVLTSMYFLNTDGDTRYSITKKQLAKADLFGSIPSIFMTIFLYKIVPDVLSYKAYIFATIILSAMTTISTPLVRYYLIPIMGRNAAGAILCVFYSIKMLFNYYIYTNALNKEIAKSVFKSYRARILNIVTIVKMLSSAVLFHVTSTIMYVFMRKEDYGDYEPYNHFVPFILVAVLQIISIVLFERSKFKKKDMY